MAAAAAAAAMHVTPAAIAADLDQAEQTCGITLVTRAGAKGVFPTSTGHEVGWAIGELLERYILMSGISDLKSRVLGKLAIGCRLLS